VEDSDKSREDAWFREHEKELLEVARIAREKRERARAGQETTQDLARLKALHHMKCPKCGHDMKTEDMQGVEVDRCTFCEGFFVDAGEFEALYLKKSASERGAIARWLLKI
jgi:hypothetical protein